MNKKGDKGTLQRMKRWTNEEAIGLLVDFGKKLGRTPKVKDVDTAKDMPDHKTYANYFGSWNNALEMAGFSPNLRRDWTKREMVKLLAEFGKKLGKTPTRESVNAARNMPYTATYTKFFGSWTKALEAAGFSPNRKLGWTDEEMIELLVELSKKLGRTPKIRDVNAAEDMPSSPTYIKHFGSWNNALRVAKLK